MRFSHLTHAALMVMVLLLAFGMYGVWHSKVEQESANGIALETKIQTASQQAMHAEEQKDTLQKITSDELSIQSYFIQTADIVPFLESLQSTGKSLGTTVTVVSVATVSAKPRDYVNLSLTITGPFDSVMRTLGALEYGPYDITASNVTLDTTGTPGTASDWTAEATFHVGTVPTPKTTKPKSVATPDATTVAATSTATTTAVTTTAP